jgi:hypothetical protein
LRKLLGIAAIIVVAVILEFYESPPVMHSFHIGGYPYYVLSFGSFLVATLVFTLGSIVARGHFLVYALAFAVFLWLILQYLLYDISAPAESVSIFEIARSNLPVLLAYLAAATVGAFAGGWYYEHEAGASQSAS